MGLVAMLGETHGRGEGLHAAIPTESPRVAVVVRFYASARIR
jgi:hypothetical protein